MTRFPLLLTLAAISAVIGCVDQEVQKPAASESVKKPAAPEQVGEFDPAAGKTVADQRIRMSNPVTGALEAYGPLKQKVTTMGVDHAVRLFQATEGRYPKDLDEFMTRVIKQNHIKLPNLADGQSYEYDVENHVLLIVNDSQGGN